MVLFRGREKENNSRDRRIECSFAAVKLVYKAKRIKKATIKQNRPMASDRAKPKMAYEKSCDLSDGLRA